MKPGDVVIAVFPGAQLTKARPAVVLSTDQYQTQHPDVILGVVTTKRPPQPAATDYEIQDWKAAGLHAPSWFRLFLITTLQREARVIGQLTLRDWREVQVRIRAGIRCAS